MIKKLNLFEKTLFIFLTSCLLYILIYNILHFDPILGYDAEAHYSYIDTFSRYLPRSIHLPTESESREFFGPPIPYLFPSFIQVICRNISKSENLLKFCQPIYGNLTQIFQNILYLLSIYINFKTLRNYKKSTSINLSFFMFTMMLAVNYRTVSVIKGEIYILFFISLMINIFSRVQMKYFDFNKNDVIKFGLTIGCLALTRQWVFLIFPAFFFVYFKVKNNKNNYLKFISLSFLIGFALSSWFYFNNLFKYGSLIAFNTKRNINFELNYFIDFLSFKNIGEYIFDNPIRPFFKKQFFPIFYSDIWGDYWGYFSFTSRYLDIGRNQMEIGKYLGNVNFVSLITTTLIIIFYITTVRSFKDDPTINLINYSVIFSLLGYFIWVLLYQTGSQGDTIKATYMTQALNLVIFISAISLERLKNSKAFALIIIGLIIIFLHNFQSYLSHFPMFYPNLVFLLS